MDFIYSIDKTWTLFLDRDGVINIEKKDDYIRTPDEFHFYEGVPDALRKLSETFGHIVVVTNQRGIGRGLMSAHDLDEIHEYMLEEVERSGGKIDRIYYAPDLDSDALDRKPNIGMGLKAKTEIPSIDFQKSVMVGNNLSDMKFGRNLHMKTVYVETTHPLEYGHESIDVKLNKLTDFADLF
jgi:histidinol-phosphate phosphatase family protein